jgi:hypothetical protein
MFIVVMQNSWGKNETLEAAAKIARNEGGHRGKQKRIVFKFDAEKTTQVYVDNFGSLCWEGDKPERIEG